MEKEESFTADSLEALKSDDPFKSVHGLVLRWKSEGCDQKTAESRMMDVLRVLIDADREAEADVVRDVLDCVVGWCNPKSWIFLPDSSSARP